MKILRKMIDKIGGIIILSMTIVILLLLGSLVLITLNLWVIPLIASVIWTSPIWFWIEIAILCLYFGVIIMIGIKSTTQNVNNNKEKAPISEEL